MARVALDLENKDDLKVLQAEGWRIAPGLVPGVHINAARPRVSLTARAGVTAPDLVVKATVTSGTGFP